MKNKQRIFYYDFLRAFAIIAVILCHVDGVYKFTTSSLKLAIPMLLNDIGLIGVPIFLMLSGALLLNKEYTLNEFLKKRFSRIIYPFIFWMILTLIIGIFYFNWQQDYVLVVLFGNPAPAWYIWTLIGIYLFLPIINSFLKEYSLKGLEYFMIIWAFTLLLYTFHMYPFEKLELSYFAGFIGYPILGYYLDNKKFKLNDGLIMILGLIILLVSTFLHMAFSYYAIDVVSPMYLNITIVLQGIGLFLFLKYLDINSNNNYNFIFKLYKSMKENILGKIIISLSICSYAMYFIHFIVLKFVKQYEIHSIKLLPLILIGTVCLSWLIAYTSSKLPLIKEVSGVK